MKHTKLLSLLLVLALLLTMAPQAAAFANEPTRSLLVYTIDVSDGSTTVIGDDFDHVVFNTLLAAKYAEQINMGLHSDGWTYIDFDKDGANDIRYQQYGDDYQFMRIATSNLLGTEYMLELNAAAKTWLNNSGTSDFTFKLFVTFTRIHDLWVCDEQVTSDNAGDILGDGAARYDEDAKVLYFDGDCSTSSNVIYNSIPGLTVKYADGVRLETDSTSSAAIYTSASLTIDGEFGKELDLGAGHIAIYTTETNVQITIRNAKLNVTTGNYGISASNLADETLLIDNSEVSVQSTLEAISCFQDGLTLQRCSIVTPADGVIYNGSIVMSESDHTIAKEVLIAPEVTNYDLEVCGVQVNSVNESNILGDGHFRYDPAATTLYVKGNNIYNGTLIISEVDGLIITAEGDALLNSTSEHGYDSVMKVSNTTLTSPSGSLRVIADKPEVDAIQVAKDCTLLVDSATLYAKGNRAMLGETNTKLSFKDSDVELEAGYTCIIGFESGVLFAGCAITEPVGAAIVNEQVVESDGVTEATHVVITKGAPAEPYKLWIAGTQVDDLNRLDILENGAFDYDPASNTLSIHGNYEADEDYIIKSEIPDLTIYVETESRLHAKNFLANTVLLYADTTITGPEGLLCQSDKGNGINLQSCTLTVYDADLAAGGDGLNGITGSGTSVLDLQYATLTAKGSMAAISVTGGIQLTKCHLAEPADGAVSGGTVENSDSTVATYVEIESDKEFYLLAIDGISVTETNCANILGDADKTFSFDPVKAILTVNGSYTGDDYIIASEIPDLIIDVKKDATLKSKATDCIITDENITVRGDGMLTLVSNNGACIGLDTDKAKILTVVDTTLILKGKYGLVGKGIKEALIVNDANVQADCTEAGISGFGIGITLIDCQLIKPVGGKLSEGAAVDKDGNLAGAVEIRKDHPTANSWLVTFTTERGVAPAAQEVAEGAMVVRPANPTETGWIFLGWFLPDDSPYDFSTPVTAPLTLHANWMKKGEVTQENPFTDVKSTDYFYQEVLWAYYHSPQITAGMTDTLFMPRRGCTRGQIVTFLWRAVGEPIPALEKSPFQDVKLGKFYYYAVLWAVDTGITQGVDAKHFGPLEYCRRGDAVTFLYRLSGSPEVTGVCPFDDVAEGAYYYNAVLWAVDKGITNGVTATEFRPSSRCRRCDIVTLLFRYMNP